MSNTVAASELEEGEIWEEHDEGNQSDDDEDDYHTPVPLENLCRSCNNRSPEDQCIREWVVDAHPVGKELKNCVLTFADPTDYLPPKV